MAHPGVSVKSLVSSYETRVGRVNPCLPQRRGCVSSPCSPRGASPIRGVTGPSPHCGLGGPGHRPSPRSGVDKTLLSLILYCHSGSGSMVAIDNKIEQAMLPVAVLDPRYLSLPFPGLMIPESLPSLLFPVCFPPLDQGKRKLILIAPISSSEARQDLVKSHLMFAVREEVEVLKEQIRELAERNAALEQENGLLRSLASPEQLAQLPVSGTPRPGSLAPNGPSS
uniref:TSC22 domain family member 4 n=1 Tax=Sarcophilus harrisii TaxID=9305 RepID=A0A7N4V5B6_SARHA